MPVTSVSELVFRRAAAALFSLAELAKLVSLFSMDPLLWSGDPVFRLPYGLLFLAGSLTELVLGGRLLGNRGSLLDDWLLGGLSLFLLIYRIALRMSAASTSCPCLGVARSWIPGGEKAQAFLENCLAGALVGMLFGALFYGRRRYKEMLPTWQQSD